MRMKELLEATIYNINYERMRRVVVKDVSPTLTQLTYAPERSSKIVAFISSGKDSNYRPGFEVSFADYKINNRYFKTLDNKKDAIRYAKEVIFTNYLDTQADRIS